MEWITTACDWLKNRLIEFLCKFWKRDKAFTLKNSQKYSNEDSRSYEATASLGGNATITNSDNSQHTQNQSGSNSTQAGRDVNLTINNFPLLKPSAAMVALVENRGYEITGEIKRQLPPDILAQIAEDPRLCAQLNRIQTEYAKSGHPKLRQLLVRLFLQLSLQPNRDIDQIAYEQAIETVPKITEQQFAILILILLQRYPAFGENKNVEDFIHYLKEEFCPFSDAIDLTNSVFLRDISHLQSLNCVRKLENHGGYAPMRLYLDIEMPNNWHIRNLFSKGVTRQDFESRFGDIHQFKDFISQCFQDESRLQLKTFSSHTFHQLIASKITVPDSSISNIREFLDYFNRHLMSVDEITRFLVARVPCMNNAFEAVDRLQSNQITYLGIVIAKAKYESYLNKPLDIPQWRIDEILSQP